eukprot:55665_1
MSDIWSQRWKREVPINLCLLFLSNVPFKFAVFEPKSEYSIDPFDLEDHFEPPIGKYVSIPFLSHHVWFSMENWIAKRYHTLLLYPFSYIGASKESAWTVFFTLHIVPWTGLSSFWFAYFCGSIGGALGKVSEYYYSFYMLHKNRKQRQKKYNFEDIATKQMQLAMSHTEVNTDEKIEKQSYNPHDYIDDKLLNKLYYASNAKEPYVGPEQAIYGLYGYSLALSGHYLYGELKRYLVDRINDMQSEDDRDQNTVSTVDQYKQNVRVLLSIYHSLIVALSGYKLYEVGSAYFRQLDEKQSDPGGYGHMASGRGTYGVDFGALSAYVCGLMAYPFVVNARKIWNTKTLKGHQYVDKHDIDRESK